MDMSQYQTMGSESAPMQVPAEPRSPTSKWMSDNLVEVVGGNKALRTTAILSGDVIIGDIDVEVQNGVPQHFNSTVLSTGATITPTHTTREIVFSVPKAGNDLARTLSVSFNAGANWFCVCGYGEKAVIKCEVPSFMVKGDDATTATVYEILSIGK